MPLVAGSRVGPYEILAAIGAGGMGEVWRARDTRLERDVALKVLPAETLGDDAARARLLREARLASKLNHPHICTIYDVGEVDPSTESAGSPQASSGQAASTPSDPGSLQAEGRSGRPVTYIAMELVEGQTLSDRGAEGPLPVEQILRYGQQMADALAHAHARGVVHRDFKSANVVVTPDGQVKMLDFGLAKRMTGEELADVTTVSRHSLTASGVVAGTLAYMAPEQLKGQPADARSDIWALGVVLYELAAGQRPFQGQTGFELTSAILSKPLPPLPPSVPAPLAGVIERCLAKEPGERYQQGNVVRAALEAVASGEMGAAWSAWRVVLRRRRVLLAAAGGIVLIAIVAALLLALDVGGLRSRATGAAAVSAGIVKLAVLPFANVSGDAAQDYLSDGLTTEMIALLGRLHPETLHVIARTTAMSYKKTDKPINEIGRELGVDYILEGSAQREAGRIRITADLIKVADQTQLWADRYERELVGILALQNDVAQQVAKVLALKLLPAEQARLAGAKIVDPEVYDLCLKGSSYLERLTKADFDTAEQYFQQALAKDPASAEAHAGMAGLWLNRQQMGVVSAREAGPKAKAAALRAIELNDSLAAAHRALASVRFLTDFNFPDADREFRRAIELDPNDPSALALHSQVLLILRRPDEAMPQIERAVAIDPLNQLCRVLYAFNLHATGRQDEALAQARAVLRLQPGNLAALSTVVQIAHMRGQYPDAIAAATAFYDGMGWGDVAEVFRKGLAESGYAGALRRAADVELAKHANEGGVAFDAAGNYAMAGERARALDWLEKAYADRDPNMPYIGCYRIFDPLRAEPRFQALLKAMGLTQ